jgi:hypothetical protein
MTNQEIYIAPWQQTRWLVASSMVFLVPSMYAFRHNLPFYSALLFVNAIVSANYWRKATYSMRRNVDMIYAKISFVIFFYNGVVHITTPFRIVSGYIGMATLLYCYYLSGKHFSMKNNNWYKYHASFHALLMVEQLLVLHGMATSHNKVFFAAL